MRFYKKIIITGEEIQNNRGRKIEGIKLWGCDYKIRWIIT